MLEKLHEVEEENEIKIKTLSYAEVDVLDAFHDIVGPKLEGIFRRITKTTEDGDFIENPIKKRILKFIWFISAKYDNKNAKKTPTWVDEEIIPLARFSYFLSIISVMYILAPSVSDAIPITRSILENRIRMLDKKPISE